MITALAFVLAGFSGLLAGFGEDHGRPWGFVAAMCAMGAGMLSQHAL